MWVLSFETSIRPKIHWELFQVEEVEVVASRGRCGNGDETRLQGRRRLRVGTEWEIEKDRCVRCDVGNFGPRLGEEREVDVGVGLLRHAPREPAPFPRVIQWGSTSRASVP
jgi:hypothetical protein